MSNSRKLRNTSVFEYSATHRNHGIGARIVFATLCALVILLASVTAQETWSEAGVVIDYGDERITWIWVPFEEDEITLFELLERSEIEMVTVGFGGLGEGVCQIDDTGCPVGECQQRMCQTTSSSPFWRIMKLGDGEWSMTGAGISGTRVVDGEIYALSWSATNPELPIVSLDELANNAGADRSGLSPVSAMHTDGESSSSGASTNGWAAAAGAFGLVVVSAGVLVFRARSANGAAA